MSYVMAEPDINPADDPDPFYIDRIAEAVSAQNLDNIDTQCRISQALHENGTELDDALCGFIGGNSAHLNAAVQDAREAIAKEDDAKQRDLHNEQEYCNG